jgi:uncharacterized YccA/Bax inhibitor family protein
MAEPVQMTLQGTINKTLTLLALVFVTAIFNWYIYSSLHAEGFALVLGVAGLIGGLVFALITTFKKTWSGFTAPVYALFEGLFLGGISVFLETKFPGIVVQAVFLTFGTAAALLFAYKSRLIQATENFKLGIAAATGGIGLIYLVSFGLSFFGIKIPYIHESGIIGIGFSLFVVVIAALNLVLDFDFIEQGVHQGAPRYMEWYAGFGLLVTLVWLYIEILRLLTKLNSRD